jgi:putative ABC transport system permease protein
MNALESLRLAVESLRINRLRSFLTTLGIVIGVGAVISLVSLGRAVELYIADQFSDLGSTLLEITSTRPESPTRTRVEPLTTVEGDALSNPAIAPSIRRIAMTFRVSGSISAEGNRTQLLLTGATANYAGVVSWGLRYGSFFTQADLDANARVAVLGLDVVESLFSDRDFNPVGLSVRINERVFTVIGVMQERGGAFISEDNVVFIPLTTAQTRLANARTRDGGYRVTTIHVDVLNEDLLEQARTQIYSYLDVAHSVTFVDERDYSISSDAGLLATINRITGVLTIFLGMIASISLLVGGIGIMNIMLVSVTERTREIGLRKAVGARGSDILGQFLIESVLLSLLGGLIGIGLGWVVALIGSTLFAQLQMRIDGDAIVLATGVSTVVGVFFGYYPARRAARMKPIDALRFE